MCVGTHQVLHVHKILQRDICHLHVHVQKATRQQTSSEFKVLSEELCLKTAEPSNSSSLTPEQAHPNPFLLFPSLNTKLSPARVSGTCLPAAGALMHTVHPVAQQTAHERQQDTAAPLESSVCPAPDGFSADPRSKLYSGQVN